MLKHLIFGLMALLLGGCAGQSSSPASVRADAFPKGGISLATFEHPEPALHDIVLAVLPFTTARGLSPDGKFLAEVISQRASRNPGVKVVERVRISAVLDELHLNDTQPINQDTAVKIGNLLGANVLLLGSAAANGKSNLFTMRLVKVETGEIVGGVSEDKPGDLAAVVVAAYDQLDGKLPSGQISR